jgi:hypothetical protein
LAGYARQKDRLRIYRLALQPETVVPGHFKPGAPLTLASVHFTRDYIRAFIDQAAQTADSPALIAAMRQRYPDLVAALSLELSAKVAKDEMAWP